MRARCVLQSLIPLALLAFATAPAPAQDRLTPADLYTPELGLEDLDQLRWTPVGDAFAYVEADSAGRGTDLWRMDVRTGERSRLVTGASLVPPGEREPIPIEGYEWSPDGSKLLLFSHAQRVWRLRTKGRFYIYDLAARTLRPISSAPGWQQFAKFSPDGRRIGFVRDHDLHVVDLTTGRETRLTADGGDAIINGTFDWVYEEELGLRDGWRWSPDGARIAFWRLDQSPIPRFFLIDELPLYPQLFPIRYPKAGEPNSRVKVGVIELDGGRITWIDVEPGDGYVARMDWAASPAELVVQRLNRHQNRLDVLLADVRTGRSRVLFTETDSAWIDPDWTGFEETLTWVRDGQQFLWTSERDGYHHIYLYQRDGSLARQLTRGEFDVVHWMGVDHGGWVYYVAADPTPLERQLFRVRLDGGRPQRLSQEPGAHDEILLAPDARHYLEWYSRADAAPVRRLHSADGRVLRVLRDNADVRRRLAALGARPPEFFRFRTSDGVELNGWMIRPPDFDPERRYPVLMYVYGGPGSQTVLEAWGAGAGHSRYLWHQLLAQRGYIIASVDNRGTGSRGRAFKKLTYLDLGTWEAHDQIEAARYLGSLPFVDPGRIGIWGASYGGTMSALTMMRGGTLFRAGIAVAPVTHWKLYDTIYTERYMRTPAENPEGYRRSAPLEHAAGLTGQLLLVHGTGDDNVHFQNTVQLVQALQDAGKQFALMVYPNRTHALGGVHLYELYTRWIEQRL
ncbi:MAG: S9 family peptidase [Gemmatimonadetes bacterium]|nr:S9 family peptidase [Gemmatimonadota bacterium]